MLAKELEWILYIMVISFGTPKMAAVDNVVMEMTVVSCVHEMHKIGNVKHNCHWNAIAMVAHNFSYSEFALLSLSQQLCVLVFLGFFTLLNKF